MQKKLLFLVALMLSLTMNIMAQVTTSSLSGKVVADGEDIIGATVVAVHEPSGTRYNAVTNEKGRYSIQGMRVGGPYTVTFSYTGYKNDVRTNVRLDLGEQEIINADLKEDAVLLGEVTVTGQAGRGGNGASTNFSLNQIQNTPTVDRNIYDVAKLSPLVNESKIGGISIAGTNNRYNSFQIDGMTSNDVFGLASSGTNGGQAGSNPISMDAIEQIQVVASPFDVRQSGFTGGAINAITKSGTNKWIGSAYTYYTDENMYGRWNQRTDKKDKLTDQSTTTYGATLGGPIIKDKLFFFGNIEYKKNTYPTSYYAGADSYFMTTQLAQSILDRYNSFTGINDTYGSRDIKTTNLSLLGRLDWNINDNNHLSFRYQLNSGKRDNFSIGQYAYIYNGSGYQFVNHTNSFVAELTSHISESLYNELRAGVTFVRDHRETAYDAPIAYINNAGSERDVENGYLSSTGSYTIGIGTDYSSGVNFLNQDIWTLEDNLSWYVGNHTLTFGTHNEFYNMKNGFIQAAFGEYIYNDITDFFNDNTSSFVWKYSDPEITGTTRWATPFKAGQFGVYVQDKWDPSTNFSLTYGMRFDVPVYFNSPSTNPEYNASDYSKNYNSVVGRKPYSYVAFSPRVGFRWYTSDSHNTMLRGGAGIFNGRSPFVWLENAWANTGIEMKGTTLYSPNAPKLSEYDRNTYTQDWLELANSGKADMPVINTVDRKFHFPQVFRANLALEQNLPFGIKMTLEALYSKNLNNVWYENLALRNNGEKVYAVEGSEASAINWYSSVRGSYNAIINIKNTNKGYSYSFSGKLEKSFDFGLNLMASYTFGHSYSVNDGTSSVANSNWGYYYCVDPNKQEVAPSMFDMAHRVIAVASYNSKRYGNGRWQSHVGLTYNGFTGQRYSLTMSDAQSASFNGDYRRGNTLLYIPTEAELQRMEFASEDDRTAFGNWIRNDKYAKNHRGQYAKRNSNHAPWENHFDFHLSQDFYYLKERGSKIEISFDILNVANLLNHDWGTTYSSSFNENILGVSTRKLDDGTNRVGTKYTFVGYTPQKAPIESRWHMQLGLRVTF